MSETADSSPLRIAVLISGGGTTLKNLLDKIDAEQLDVEVTLVLSSSSQAGGLQYAEQADIPAATVKDSDFSSKEQFSEAVFEPCRKANVDYVVMGGFLKLVPIPADFENRVINIHPALIPSFCGHGFYGRRVHQAVLDYGAKISGCTVHFVDNEYDHGPVILQRSVPVENDDTAESLAARVFEAECEAYPAALQLIASDKVHVEGRIVRVER